MTTTYCKENVTINDDNDKLIYFNAIKMYIGVSGPYNLQSLRDHLHKRGLDSSILDWICRSDLAHYSPTLRLKEFISSSSSSSSSNTCFEKFPFVSLFHGCDDKTIPESNMEELAQVLRLGGAKVSVCTYKGNIIIIVSNCHHVYYH